MKSKGGCNNPDGSPCTHSELQGLSMTPPSIGSGTRQKPERERRSERASMAFLWGERAARSSNTTDGADGMKKGPPRERLRGRSFGRSSKVSGPPSLPPGDRPSWPRGHRGRRAATGGRVDQVWTPGVRVSAAKMDWLISKHLNPSMSGAAA